MSRDYRERVLEDAAVLGTPCVLRVGRVVAVCSSVSREPCGLGKVRLSGSTVAKEFPIAAQAKLFVDRAVAEKGWACSQRAGGTLLVEARR